MKQLWPPENYPRVLKARKAVFTNIWIVTRWSLEAQLIRWELFKKIFFFLFLDFGLALKSFSFFILKQHPLTCKVAARATPRLEFTTSSWMVHYNGGEVKSIFKVFLCSLTFSLSLMFYLFNAKSDHLYLFFISFQFDWFCLVDTNHLRRTFGKSVQSLFSAYPVNTHMLVNALLIDESKPIEYFAT